MNTEQKERLAGIQTKVSELPNCYSADFHFLLSIVKGQEAVNAEMCECSHPKTVHLEDSVNALRCLECDCLNYRSYLHYPFTTKHDNCVECTREYEPPMIPEIYYHDEVAATDPELKWVRHSDYELLRTRIAAACVERVKSINPMFIGKFMDSEWVEVERVITELESLSIEKQKSLPCGAPRPDDGSECLYGVCPRPRDGCSEYCWQHHGTQCVVQEQKAKQS